MLTMGLAKARPSMQRWRDYRPEDIAKMTSHIDEEQQIPGADASPACVHQDEALRQAPKDADFASAAMFLFFANL